MTARVAASRVLLPVLLVALLVPAATVQTQGGVDKSLYFGARRERKPAGTWWPTTS